jgi:hypothetical protein
MLKKWKSSFPTDCASMTTDCALRSLPADELTVQDRDIAVVSVQLELNEKHLHCHDSWRA